MPANSIQDLPESLTEREQEILTYLASHLSNQEIANKLHLAEKTVRWYNSQIYQKLGVSRRAEAVDRANMLGLLTEPAAAPVRHNLPHQATSFVGRQREIAKLTTLFAEAAVHLVTILAPGGMGKTRLALTVAGTMLGHHADGVFFVPLAPLTDADSIVRAIAEQVGFSFYGGDTPRRQLLGFLRDRTLLLVLDNFEHLLDAAQYVDEIIRAAPGVRILTTSRERLGLQSETVFVLRGLDYSLWEKPGDIGGYGAVELFMQCARRIRPDFELQPGDQEHLIRICRLTGGLPLALELAAGWLNTLPIEHIAEEIQQGIDILETELRDVPERHRSIRVAFDRTWQRMAAADQEVFMRLSVFRGGFTWEAASAIADANRHNLRKLSNKALIEVTVGDRYVIHELLRQFGAEKLAESGETTAIQAKHTAFFANFMAKCQRHFRTIRQLDAVELVAADFENVRAAWLNALDQQRWADLHKFLDSLRFYCEVRTRSQEGVELLQRGEQVVRSAPVATETELLLGGLLARLGWFYYDIGLPDKSTAACDEAIRLLRQYDSPGDLLAALYSHQALALTHGKPESGAQVQQEGLDLARSIDDRTWEGHFLVWSGIRNVIATDFPLARSLAEAGLTIFESLGDRWGGMRAYSVLGDIEESQANYVRATFCFQESLARSQAFGHNFTIGANSTHLARIAFHTGNHTVARQRLCDALRALLDAGYLWASPFPLGCAAQMLVAQDELIRAVEILGAIDKHLTAFRRNDQIARSMRADLAARLTPEEFAAAWAHGQQRELGMMIEEVLAEFL